MALQLGALRDALLAAGAPSEKADKAAEEVASYENRLSGIETKLTKLDGRMNLLTWMIGGVYAVLVILGAPSLWLLLRVAANDEQINAHFNRTDERLTRIEELLRAR